MTSAAALLVRFERVAFATAEGRLPGELDAPLRVWRERWDAGLRAPDLTALERWLDAVRAPPGPATRPPSRGFLTLRPWGFDTIRGFAKRDRDRTFVALVEGQLLHSSAAATNAGWRARRSRLPLLDLVTLTDDALHGAHGERLPLELTPQSRAELRKALGVLPRRRSPESRTLEALVAAPARHHGEVVRTRGRWLHGFETSRLVPDTELRDDAPWCRCEGSRPPTGARVELVGWFSHAPEGGLGHLGSAERGLWVFDWRALGSAPEGK